MKKGVIFGILWGFLAWIPYYTDHLSELRNFIGIPAAIGLELELALKIGDAFIYSILISALFCGITGMVIKTIREGFKIIGLGKRKTPRRGL